MKNTDSRRNPTGTFRNDDDSFDYDTTRKMGLWLSLIGVIELFAGAVIFMASGLATKALVLMFIVAFALLGAGWYLCRKAERRRAEIEAQRRRERQRRLTFEEWLNHTDLKHQNMPEEDYI